MILIIAQLDRPIFHDCRLKCDNKFTPLNYRGCQLKVVKIGEYESDVGSPVDDARDLLFGFAISVLYIYQRS